ncbi:hypothetical protein ACE01N_03270 [Saccharicrinis sp. FJH2]|uniref:hypothetical protein n=1 Tax=Saccharicrinis sp. FJH65 TaxID=3344659 RepID=UPI0035F43FDD
MSAQKNPDELYKAAIQSERQALTEQGNSIQINMKSDKTVRVRRIVYYASVAAAIVAMFLIFNPSGKQDRQLKTFQTMVSNMEFTPPSETFRFDTRINQINKLNQKIEEMNKDDMVNRLNAKMKKYKQQNKQL